MALGAANFNRLKTWIKERLLFSDLNSEFNNILTNFNPDGMAGLSPDNTTMDSSTNPAPYVSGTQVRTLASSLTGELKGLRYMLQSLFGTVDWWSDPGRCFAANPADLVLNMAFDGASAAEALVDYIERGGIINLKSLSSADITAASFTTSQKKFGAMSFVCGSGNVLASPNKAPNIGSLSCWFRNLTAGDYLAFNPLMGTELFLDGSGFLNLKQTLQTTASETAKNTKLITGTVSRAGSTTWQNAIAQYTINSANGASNDLLSLFKDATAEGTQLSAQTLAVTPGKGGLWIFGAKRNDPTWTQFLSMKVLPDAAAVSAYSAAGNGTGAIESDGLLRLTSGAGGTGKNYSRTPSIDLTQFTVEAKVRQISANAAGNITVFSASDTVNLRKLSLNITQNGQVQFKFFASTFMFQLDNPDDFNVFRVTSTGATSPVAKLYINGQLIFSATNADATGAIGDNLFFGVSAGAADCYFEYFTFLNAAAISLPLAINASGQLDDINVAKSVYPAQVITQLQNNKAQSVFAADPKLGLTLPSGELKTASTVVGTGNLPASEIFFASDGKTPINVECEGFLNYSTASVAWTFGNHTNPTLIDGPKTNVYARFSIQKVFPVGLQDIALSIVDNVGGGTNVFSGQIKAFQARKIL